MGHSNRGHFRGYVVACVSVAAAGLSIRLLQAVGYTGFSPLFAALIICAWYGGIGPAAFLRRRLRRCRCRYVYQQMSTYLQELQEPMQRTAAQSERKR
jgi:hypothetical protein